MDTHQCSIWPGDGALNNFRRNQSSSMIFWDARCFDCPTACIPRYGLNMLDNSGFEVSPALYGPWTQLQAIYPEEAHGRIARPGYNSSQLFTNYGRSWYVTQSFRGCQSELYKVSLDFKIDQYPDDLSILPVLSMRAGDLAIRYNVDEAQNDTWISISEYLYSFKSGIVTGAVTDTDPIENQETIVLDFEDETGDKLASMEEFLDNVKLVQVDRNSFQPSASAPELLENGNFESGKLAPWIKTESTTQYGISKVRKPGINSTYAFYLTGNGSAYAQFYQTIQGLTAGAEYLFQYDYQVTTVTGLYVSINHDVGTRRTLSFGFGACEAGINACNMTLKRPFVAPAGTVNVTMSIEHRTYGAAAPKSLRTTIIDNISLKAL